MLIAEDVEVPDKCPENCKYQNSFRDFGQSAICGRCPVFCCSTVEPEKEARKDDLDDNGYCAYCLIEPYEYRRDWALEWQRFFETGNGPDLKL